MTIIEEDWTATGRNSSGRYGAAVRLWLLHTEQGRSTTGNAKRLAKYCQNPNSGVSYHYVGDDEFVIDVVDTDRASWSVLDANPFAINFCFAGSFIEMSEDEWMERFSDTIDYVARLIVQDAAKYNPLVPAIIDYNQLSKGKAGVSDHRGITVGLGMGTHTDVGDNFPWKFLAERIQAHAEGVDIPVVVNMIDAMAAAAPWLGERITKGENTTPDGRGRWAQFTNGYIYWTPTTGAIPIPTLIFETWAALGYERGPLGYPVNYHTILPVDADQKVGDCQAFEGGMIYRKYEQNGHPVWGAIGERWKRDGFEKSRWGWPVGPEMKIGDGGSAYQDYEGGRMVYSPGGVIAQIPTDGPDSVVPAEPHG